MRLITRADLDGLTSAILLQEVEPIEDVVFAHPKDVQDGKVDVRGDDIVANLPYDPRAALWFDHHASQSESSWLPGVKGAFEIAPSAARVISNHYKSPKFARYTELLDATDRLDAALLTHADIVHPRGWILIGFTLDPRSGLGAFKEYFRHLMALAKQYDATQILADPQVRGHIERLAREEGDFRKSLVQLSRQDGNVVITDTRGHKNLPSGNRFLIYDLFPTINVSVRVADGYDGEFASIQVGHNILKRDCNTSIGDLLAKYGGGGHQGAGTCQPLKKDADRVLAEIIDVLKRNG